MPPDPVAICHRCPHRGPLVGRSVACTIDGVDIRDHAARYECPAGLYPDRGAGDALAAAVKVLTLGKVTPCESCRSRQKRLNALLPFRPPPAG